MGLIRAGAPGGGAPARGRGRRWAVPVFAALGVLLVLGGLAAPRGGPPAPEPVTVFAASSLQDVLLEAGRRFEAVHPNLQLRFNFAGSQVLFLQLTQGAEADLFAPADWFYMEAARTEGLIEGDASLLARGRMVVIVPAANPGAVQHLGDLERAGLRLVLADESVPAGRYARRILERASGDRFHGAGFAGRVLERVVSHETNVRQVVAKVRLGEADAGMVYATDVTPAAREYLRVIEIPPGMNVEVRYPVARIRGAPNRAGGQAFLAFLLSAEGQALLRSFGFQAGADDRG